MNGAVTFSNQAASLWQPFHRKESPQQKTRASMRQPWMALSLVLGILARLTFRGDTKSCAIVRMDGVIRAA
jgi:hypothetical protein